MKHTLLFTIVLTLVEMIFSPVVARVYHATPHKFVQPDGDTVSVRLFGTDLYMDAESEDGYTLIRDEVDGYICYAMLSADGREYASSGIRYNGGAAPSEVSMIVKPHIRLNAERRTEIIEDHKSLLGLDKDSAPQLRAATSLPDTVYGVCLMIDFADRKFTVSREDVETFLNSSDRTVYGNARSIKEHFRWMSGGKLTYINYLPKDIYHAPNNFEYYSPSDATDYTTDRFFPVVTDALLAISKEKDGFDLNDISFNGRKIMAINIFYAGASPSKWATGLWPHQGGYTFNLKSKYSNISSREWHAYQMSNLDKELTMGTFVHENGHLVLGLPDFYSYEDENDDNNIKDFNIANTFWTLDDKNPELLNPYSMDELGWLTNKQDITNIKDGRKITIKQEVGNAAVFYGTGANANERYYMEVRDKHYANYYGTKNPGVMIWHVNTKGDNNHAGKPELLDGRPATSKNCMWNSKNGPKVFDDNSNPSAKWYDGNNSGIYLWEFSDPGSTMTFRCGNELRPLSFATEYIPEGEADTAYYVALEAEGGEPDYSFSLKNGYNLPAGLVLSDDGIISGTPTEGFDGNVRIVLKDAKDNEVEKEFYLKIKKIVTVREYSFDVNVDVNDGYDGTIVDINNDEISDIFGISFSELVSRLGGEVSLYSVESNGDVVKEFTANKGYWYNLSGNVEKWTATTTSAAVFVEIDLEGNGMHVGLYPGNTQAGDSCTVKQIMIFEEQQIMLTYNIKVRDRSNPADVENVFVNPTDDGNIRVYNEKGQFIGEIDSFTELENIGSTHGVYMLEQCGVWYKIVK